LNILIAENKISYQDIYKVMLDNKHVLEICNDGHDAWNKWQKNRYGVVITDYHLPKVDGFELIRRIREFDITTPIFMLSSMSGLEARLDKIGAKFLAKNPYNIRYLSSLLSR